MVALKSKRSLLIFMLVLLVLAVFSFSLKVTTVTSHPKTLVVDNNGNADFRTIQEAIDDATAGDVVFVKSGVYYEKIDVNKPNLTIIGEGNQLAIIDGGGDGPVVKISADDVTFTSFTVRRGGNKPGIEILKRANVTFNKILQCQIGVFVGFKCTITNNYISSCGQGALFYSCFNVTMEANYFSSNTVGISLSGSNDNLIANNTITQSTEGGHGITILSNSYGNIIGGNLIWNNSHGMWFSGGSSKNIVVKNTIAKKNIIGIELTDGYNNTIYHNNFIENKKQVTTNTVNKWDNGYPSGGNYWSDYKGKYPESKDEHSGVDQKDPGSDGIWDIPYTVFGDPPNVDKYPLVRPFGPIPDNKPPETMHDYDGKWRKEDFAITLTASDDLSGVEEIYYIINNVGTVKRVSVDGEPLINFEGANNTIEFWSVDYMGNVEEHNILSGIKLDKTPPVAVAGNNLTVKVGSWVKFDSSGSYDSLSGIEKYVWDLGNGTISYDEKFSYNFSKPGTYIITLTVYDVAGNFDVDKIQVLVVPDEIPFGILPLTAFFITISILIAYWFKKGRRRHYRSKLLKRKN